MSSILYNPILWKRFLIIFTILISSCFCTPGFGQYSFPAQSSIVAPNIEYFYSVPPTCYNYFWSCSNPNFLLYLNPYNTTPNCYVTWYNPNPYPITAYLYLNAVGPVSGILDPSGDGDTDVGSDPGGIGDIDPGNPGIIDPSGDTGDEGGESGPSVDGPEDSGGGGGEGGDSGGDGGGGGDERTTSSTTTTTAPVGDCSSYTWAVTIMPNQSGCPSPVNLYACGDYSIGPYNMGATNTVYAGGPSSVCTPGVAGAFTVESGGIINMKAGVNIQLQPGFTVKAGGKFAATIGVPCQDGVDFRTASPVVNSNNVLSTPVASGNSVNVYPNPTTGLITIKFSYAKTSSAISIKVLDLIGQQVYEQLVDQAQQGKAIINLSEQPAGIYIVQVTSGSNVSTQKVILEK